MLAIEPTPMRKRLLIALISTIIASGFFILLWWGFYKDFWGENVMRNLLMSFGQGAGLGISSLFLTKTQLAKKDRPKFR